MSGWNSPPAGGGWDRPPPPGGWGAPPPNYGAGYPPVPRTSPRAVWVGVCGIGSLIALFTVCIGFVPAIVALCLSPEAKREIRESRGALSGDGLRRAGVICAWVTIGITVLVVVLAVWVLSVLDWSIGESVSW